MVVGVGVWQYKSSQPAPVPFLAEEMDYGFAALEMDLNALESEIELSLLDIS
jgi:hypothetical protein